jgi:hypothetical protein
MVLIARELPSQPIPPMADEYVRICPIPSCRAFNAADAFDCAACGTSLDGTVPVLRPALEPEALRYDVPDPEEAARADRRRIAMLLLQGFLVLTLVTWVGFVRLVLELVHDPRGYGPLKSWLVSAPFWLYPVMVIACSVLAWRTVRDGYPREAMQFLGVAVGYMFFAPVATYFLAMLLH